MHARPRQLNDVNAFRVLGLPANATERQIVARLDQLRALAAADGTAMLNGPWGAAPAVRNGPALEAAAARLRQPDARFIDTITWFWGMSRRPDILEASMANLVAMSLLEAEDCTSPPAKRLRAATDCVSALRGLLSASRTAPHMKAAGLTTVEASRMCADRLRPILHSIDSAGGRWSRDAAGATDELAATLRGNDGFASLVGDAPKRRAPRGPSLAERFRTWSAGSRRELAATALGMARAFLLLYALPFLCGLAIYGICIAAPYVVNAFSAVPTDVRPSQEQAGIAELYARYSLDPLPVPAVVPKRSVPPPPRPQKKEFSDHESASAAATTMARTEGHERTYRADLDDNDADTTDAIDESPDTDAPDADPNNEEEAAYDPADSLDP